jgi:hypothetical protein
MYEDDLTVVDENNITIDKYGVATAKIDLKINDKIKVWGLVVKNSKFETDVIKFTPSFCLMRSDKFKTLGIPVGCYGNCLLQVFGRRKSFQFVFQIDSPIEAGSPIVCYNEVSNKNHTLCLLDHDNCSLVLHEKNRKVLSVWERKLSRVDLSGIQNMKIDEFFNDSMNKKQVYYLLNGLVKLKDSCEMYLVSIFLNDFLKKVFNMSSYFRGET